MFPQSPRLLPSLEYPTFESLSAADTVVVDWFSNTRVQSPQQTAVTYQENVLPNNFSPPSSPSRKACLSMTHRRGRRWTTDEDALLLSLIEIYGKDWRELAMRFPGKSAKQIKERFLNQLDRRIIDCPWTANEDFHLILMIRDFGRSWCRIANEFPGRTELMLKNRYHSFLRKKFDDSVFSAAVIDEDFVKRVLEKAVRRNSYEKSQQLHHLPQPANKHTATTSQINSLI